MALVVAPFTAENVTAELAWLESLTRLASHVASFLNVAGNERSGRSASAPNQALARAAASDSPEELAYAITNNLRNKLGCEQVALGLVARRRVRILSISGLDHVANQSTGVVGLRAAMEECYDAQQPIVYHSKGAWSANGENTEYRLHKQWFTAASGDAVASIPLRAGDKIVAVLSIRKRAEESFAHGQIDEIRTRVEPFAPALLLARDATRGLVRHAADSVGNTVAALTGPGRRGMKAVAAIIAVAIGWFVFGTMEYQLAVSCLVAPAEVRHVTTPFDGVLASAAVIQGDYVQRGDVLCEMDQRDLDQQRAELTAEIAVLERERDRAMAETSPVDVQLALAKQRLAQAKLDVVNTRIEQATVRSPIDGVVVCGDLRKRIGGVLTRGEPLFEVAPLDKWMLELHVPDADADELKTDLEGVFAPHARPEQAEPFRVVRIRPSAEVLDQKNVYVAEADIDLPFAWMRPGMEGVAKIRIERRPVWWLVLHRAIEYVRLNLWL
jgi:hypothetical protein